MDPNFSRNTAADSVRQALYDTLIYENKEGTLVESLATGFTFPDDLTMTMSLREGVVFHNGDPFNAESVKFSIERVQDKQGEEGSQLLRQFAAIEEVEIVDDSNVILHFSEPDGNILYSLTRLAMVPAGLGTDILEQGPVGTGPYSFVSYSSDAEVVVNANPNYWSGSPKGVPLAESVVFRIILEDTTRSAALAAGEVDIAMNIPLDQVALVEGAGKTTLTFNDGRIRILVINTINSGPGAASASGAELEGYEALANVTVRQALNYAIDRETVSEVLYRGIAVPLGQPFSPGGFGYDPSNQPYPYDPDRARELLAEAGYPDGFFAKLRGTQATPTDEIAVIIDNLSDIGVEVEYEIVDPAVANELLLAGDPGALRYQLWNNAESFLNLMVRTGGRPYTAYSNPDVDALFDEQLRTLDPDARTDLINDIIALIREDPIGVYLWSSVGTAGWNPDRVSGFVPHARGWLPVTDVEVLE